MLVLLVHFQIIVDVIEYYCCNLSGGFALIVWFTTNGMCVKNNTIIYSWPGKQEYERLRRGSSADVNVWAIEHDD